MCAHLLARWCKEEFLNVFLNKTSPGWSRQECLLSPFKEFVWPSGEDTPGAVTLNIYEQIQEYVNLWPCFTFQHFVPMTVGRACRARLSEVFALRFSPQYCKTWLAHGHSEQWVGSADFLGGVQGESVTRGKAKCTGNFEAPALMGLIRGG